MKSQIIFILLLSLLFAFEIRQQAKQPETNTLKKQSWILYPGQTLYQEQVLVSPNGRYYCIMQIDGNFVVYDSQPVKRALWASKTDGQRQCGPFSVGLGQNGNLVLWGESCRYVMWQTATYVAGAFLYMQDDGNLVLYDSLWHPYWACCS